MEAVRGHLLQSRYYSNGVMNVGRGYMHGQGEAVLVDQNVDFYWLLADSRGKLDFELSCDEVDDRL
jgi:hypothetical protein